MKTYSINRDGATIWRQGATLDELARVREVDAMLQQIEAHRAILVGERHSIISRACSRGRYAAAKKIAAE